MTSVNDLMSHDVVTLDEADSLLHAGKLFRLDRIRHLPVVRGRKLVGLVTHRDYLREMTPERRGNTENPLGIEAIMSHPVHTVTPETRARDALRAMVDNKYGCLPVVDAKGNLVGILTETDLLRFADRILGAVDAESPAIQEPPESLAERRHF